MKRGDSEGMMKEYLTPEDVVLRYQGKITVRTLANWRSSGVSPPFTKVGGRILYPFRELLEWEKKRTGQSTSSYGKIAVAWAAICSCADFTSAICLMCA